MRTDVLSKSLHFGHIVAHNCIFHRSWGSDGTNLKIIIYIVFQCILSNGIHVGCCME
jgi:hypothetical protein